MPVKVSVIVAVYNPGEDIDELLDSLDQQSLPADEFEVIFADDDSTDGSRARLREWAVTRPHVRVLHNTPNSGWPGKPRNMAINLARGEYLFFADNDDKFAPRALEWMYDYAIQTGADVVIPKEAGVGRRVPRALFRRNIEDARLGEDPILALLTPHKLVRTELVRANAIRFPEGRVRLEDHLFLMKCYFAADRIAVLGEKLCYYWMRRASGADNASNTPSDPSVYARSIEAVLEVVEENTEPGTFRNKLYSHWYSGKILNPLGGSLLSQTPKYQADLLGEYRRLSERFGLGESQWPWLGAAARLRSHLVRHGTLEDLLALAEAERGVRVKIEIDEVSWTKDDSLRIGLTGHLTYADGTPVRTVREGGKVYWDTAAVLPGLSVPKIDISDQKVSLSVLVSDRETLSVEYATGTSEPLAGDLIGARSETIVDVSQYVEANPDGAILDLRVRLVGAGWSPEMRLPVGNQKLPERGQVGGQTVEPYATKDFNNLSVRIRQERAMPVSGEGALGKATAAWSAYQRGRQFVARGLHRVAARVDVP